MSIEEIPEFKPVNCIYCRMSGWLKVIRLDGMHNGREVSWVFDYNNQDRYWEFLAKNSTFQAYGAVVPCACDNGSQHNKLGVNKDREWISMDRRNEMIAKSIRFSGDEEAASAYEDYFQSETAKALNAHIAGKMHRIRDISEYPKMNPDMIRAQFKDSEKEESEKDILREVIG